MDWVVAGAYGNELEALLAKGALEAAGIETRAQLNNAGNALLGGLGMQNGPTEILVQTKDAEKARAILGGN